MKVSRHPRHTQHTPPDETVPTTYREAWSRRLPALVHALTGRSVGVVPITSPQDLSDALGTSVDTRDRGHVWLLLAVLTGRLPDETTVVELARDCYFDAPTALWEALVVHTTQDSAGWTVRVAESEVLVDLAHTVSTGLTTGIQRVARETARRWFARHPCVAVAWSGDFQSIRELTEPERRRIEASEAEEDTRARPEAAVVVPWRSTYLLPELAAEPGRSSRLLALARFSPNRTGVLGFDCVPLTSAETTQLGFSAVFAGNLAAVRHFDQVATISDAARVEYTGWTRMLDAIGVAGPAVTSVPLPVEAQASTPDHIDAARQLFLVGTMPLVLVVGSHEPRKNHLAILHAAELLWRDGVELSLSFIGGNSWGSDAFTARCGELQRAGRPLQTVSRLSDDLLWAAYRLARCTVFPSFNEGFGLPVAESLAVGTPAITSSFGSMLELADGGGALTVDPHDDHALAAAIRSVVADDRVHSRLRAQALARPVRTWDTYARETWTVLTGAPPDA